jgi:hypothetical protein
MKKDTNYPVIAPEENTTTKIDGKQIMASIAAFNQKAKGVQNDLECFGRLIARSYTVFGLKVTHESLLENRSNIERLFKILINLKVPPAGVHILDKGVKLYWEANYRMAFENVEDLLHVYIQFQNMLNSIKELDLVIDFAEIGSPYEGDRTTFVNTPIRLDKRLFGLAGEIMFLEYDTGHQYWLNYDDNGIIQGFRERR